MNEMIEIAKQVIMMPELILLRNILLVAWTITKFDPLHNMLRIFKESVNNIFLKIIGEALLGMTTCFKCSALWVGLILYPQMPMLAFLGSFLAFIYSKYMSGWETKNILKKHD